MALTEQKSEHSEPGYSSVEDWLVEHGADFAHLGAERQESEENDKNGAEC